MSLLVPLGWKTLIFSLAAVGCGMLFRLFRFRSLRIERIAWIIVLLLGVTAAGVTIPVEYQVVHAVKVDREIKVGRLPPGGDVRYSAPEFGEISSSREPGRLSPTLPPEGRQPTFERQSTFEPPIRRWNIETILLTLWLGGIILIFLWKTACFFMLFARLKTATAATGEFLDQWKRLGGGNGRLLLSDALGPGVVMTLRGTNVVVPRELWEDATPEVREGILRHELAHLRGGDFWWTAAARLLGLIHWFNPITYLVLRRLDEIAERLADAKAFGTDENGVKRLAESLWTFYESSPTITLRRTAFLAGNPTGGELNRRIDYLRTLSQRPGDSLMKKTALCLLLAMIFAFGLIQLKFVPIAAEEKVASEAEAEGKSPLLFDFEFVKRQPENSDRNKLQKIELYQKFAYRSSAQEQDAVQKEILRLAQNMEDSAIGGSILLDLTKEAWREKKPEKFHFWFDALKSPYWDWAKAFIEAKNFADSGDHDAAKAVLLELMPEDLRPSDKSTQEEREQTYIAVVLVVNTLAELGLVDEALELLQPPYVKLLYEGRILCSPAYDSTFIHYCINEKRWSDAGIIARESVSRGKYEEVLRFSNEIPKSLFGHESLVVYLIYSLVKKGEVDLLIELASPGIADHHSLFDALLQNGYYEKASELIRRHSLYGKHVINGTMSAKLLRGLMQNGKTQECRELMDEILEHRRDIQWLDATNTIYPALIEMHLALGNRQQAGEIFKLVESNAERLKTEGHHFSDKEFHILLALAECHAALGNRDEAMRFWEQAYSTVPEYSSRERKDKVYDIASSQARHGFQDESLETVLKTDTDRSRFAESLCNLGWQFYAQGDYDAAGIVITLLRECDDDKSLSPHIIGLTMSLERAVREKSEGAAKKN